MANTKIPVELSSTPGIVDNSNATAITIDASENVGIGTTSPSEKLSTLGNVNIGNNDSSNPFSYLRLGATQYGAADIKPENYDFHRVGLSFHVDNTADDTINPTEVMRISSAGLVGIGTTDPKSTLEVKGTFGAPATSGFASGFISRFSQSSGVGCLDVGFGDPYSWLQSRASNNYATNFALALNPNGGNVGIGTSSPATILHAKSSGDAELRLEAGTNQDARVRFGDATDNDLGYIGFNRNSGYMNFSINNTQGEHMRIDSSGNVLVGKTSSSPSSQTGSVNYGDGFFALTLTNSRADTLNVYNTSASAYRFYLTSAGQIHATSTSITAISDERLKETIVDLETGLSEVMSLQPRRFDWKNGDGENVAGFIAQEVETVLPDLISDYKHEDLDDAKSVRMGDMIPTLVKAIQEQQAQIEALQSEINELKNS